MASAVSKSGRNELCACGSGKKTKRCCGAVDAPASDAAGSFFRVAGVLTAVMLLIGGVAVVRALVSHDDTPQRVWSAEHGHWHVVGGKEGTQSAAPGKVWDQEKGQFYDAPALADDHKPEPGALQERRQAATLAAKEAAEEAVKEKAASE